MVRVKPFVLIAGVVGSSVLLLSPPPTTGSLIVDEWALASGVEDASGNIPMLDFSNFGIVQSPFTAFADNAIGPNTATTAYDFAWSGDSGSFDITTTQRVETFRVRTLSTGFIFIVPTTDLRMTINASLDYASPPGDLADVFFRMTVFDQSDFVVPLFIENLRGGNLTLQPAVGTLAFSGDVVLPAGATYRIGFLARNDNGADTNNPTGPITSSGLIHFDFQPIPEPATAWLIALGTIALHRPKRRVR